MERIRPGSWGALACALALVATACGGGSGDATLGKQIGPTTIPPAAVATTRPGKGRQPGVLADGERARSRRSRVYASASAGQAHDDAAEPLGRPIPTTRRRPCQQVFLVKSQTNGLSRHSEALDTFNGGDAEIDIHGNNDASVLGST